jgi:hypothetical protein
MQPVRGLFVLVLSHFAAIGCKDTSRFSTEPGESYCGPIVDASFVMRGFAPSVGMRMTFDADRIADAPGLLSTSDRLLDDTPMRPIPELFHDPLSTFNFGEGRDKNLLFAVDPTDPANGPSVLVVLSLMHAGDVEVRLMRGAPTADGPGAGPQGGGPLFGVFAPLTRQMGTCSF